MIRLFRWRQVPILAHWSVPALAAFVLLGGWRKAHVAVAAVAAYLAVILLHEMGHALLARRMRCSVLSISLYPIHGVCRYSDSGSAYAEAVIAWGGVLAQFAVAVPIAVYLAVFGYTPFAPVNAVLVILCPFSIGQALFNLIPVAPLDGSRAWGLFPLLLRRKMPRKQSTGNPRRFKVVR